MAQMGRLVSLEQESMDALNNLARALDQNGIITDQRLLNILRDVWFQFSLDRRSQFHVNEPGRWSGGLTVLEDVFHELRAFGMINEHGLEAD